MIPTVPRTALEPANPGHLGLPATQIVPDAASGALTADHGAVSLASSLAFEASRKAV
jgi:hypothetical protein